MPVRLTPNGIMANNEHILVVEDEEHLATGIKYNLVAEGYRVTTVGDGPSALEAACRRRPAASTWWCST